MNVASWVAEVIMWAAIWQFLWWVARALATLQVARDRFDESRRITFTFVWARRVRMVVFARAYQKV